MGCWGHWCPLVWEAGFQLSCSQTRVSPETEASFLMNLFLSNSPLVGVASGTRMCL